MCEFPCQIQSLPKRIHQQRYLHHIPIYRSNWQCRCMQLYMTLCCSLKGLFGTQSSRTLTSNFKDRSVRQLSNQSDIRHSNSRLSWTSACILWQHPTIITSLIHSMHRSLDDHSTYLYPPKPCASERVDASLYNEYILHPLPYPSRGLGSATCSTSTATATTATTAISARKLTSLRSLLSHRCISYRRVGRKPWFHSVH